MMSDTPEKLVTYTTDETISIVTLNRPAKLNAISKELRAELIDIFRIAEEDESTCVVVLRGEGRSFCVGYDINADDPTRETWRHDALKYHTRLSSGVAMEMMPWYMRKPVIASVQGHALGGGCELAMFCDITIAADNAMFGEPEIRFSQAGPGIIMPWIIGYKKARELLYLGDMIDAQAALSLGMVNRVVPAAELSAATMQFARRMALIAPEALYAAKLSINRGADASGFRNAMQAGVDIVAPLYAATTAAQRQFDEIKAREGFATALKWRTDQFKE
jgi:enoyl-CoA hydratase